MLKSRIFLLIVLLITAGRLLAQNEQPPVQLSPEETARAFYTALLTASPDSYGEVASYICSDVIYTEVEYRALVNARSGRTIDTTGLTFTTSPPVENTVYITVAGSVPGSDGTTVELPAELIRMVNEGQWKICPPNPPVRIISPSDAALMEATAGETANRFYQAFYTGDTGQLAELVCAHELNDLIQMSDENYGGGRFTLAPEYDWQLAGLQPEGQDLQISTTGILKINRDDGAVVALQDRADFPNARLIRENGWKFCGSYRPVERAAENFLTAFYRYDTFLIGFHSCRGIRMLLIDIAEVWTQRDVQEIRLPPDFLMEYGEAEARIANLGQTVVLFGDGEAVLPSETFGATARMVYEDNRWKWCQLTPRQLLIYGAMP